MMFVNVYFQYHPDKYDATRMKCTSDEAKDYFYLIDKAWKTLGDSTTRSEYDAMLRGMFSSMVLLFKLYNLSCFV